MIHSNWFPFVIFVYAAISAFGLYFIKAANGWQNIEIVIGVALYGGGFLIWLVILKSFPLSIAFPAAAGAMIVATQALGILLLKETLSMPVLIGTILIFVGIVLISTTLGRT